MSARPEQVGEVDGFYSVKITPLAKEIANGLVEEGHYFFKGSTQVSDAFGAAYERKDTQEALDKMITFSKELKKMRCQLMNVGFLMIDKEQEIVALTYTVQSTRFDNQPLEVKECFKLTMPVLALVNQFAELWVKAYKNRPVIEILKVSNGK